MPPTPQLKDMQALENRVARSGTVLQVHVPDHILHSSIQCGSVAKQPFLVDFVFQPSGIPRESNRRPSDQAIELANDGPNAVQWSCPQRDLELRGTAAHCSQYVAEPRLAETTSSRDPDHAAGRS